MNPVIFVATQFSSNALPLVHVGNGLLTLVLGFTFIVSASASVQAVKAALHLLVFEVHPVRTALLCLRRALFQFALAIGSLWLWHFLCQAN